MIEHRLIDRMIALLRKEADRMERDKNIRAEFLDMAIDFIHTYIDRCHHGKEEDILLKALDRKMVADEHRRIRTAISSCPVWSISIKKKKMRCWRKSTTSTGS